MGHPKRAGEDLLRRIAGIGLSRCERLAAARAQRTASGCARPPSAFDVLGLDLRRLRKILAIRDRLGAQVPRTSGQL